MTAWPRWASHICAAHESEPADAVLLAEEEYRWDDIELGGVKPEALTPQPLESMRMMTEEDKDVALDCMRILLTLDGQDERINAVLARLGKYYRADRVYILILGEQGRIVTMLNEWVGKRKTQHPAEHLRQAHQPLPGHLPAMPIPPRRWYSPCASRQGRGLRAESLLAVRHLPHGKAQWRRAAALSGKSAPQSAEYGAAD